MRSISILPWRLSQRATLLLLVPFNLLAALGMDLYLPVVPRMAQVLQTDATTVQVTLTLYLVMMGAGQLLFGPLSDRLGRRPILLAGAACFALSSLALAMTHSAPLFLLGRLFQAAGAAACMVVVFATVRDLYGGRPESSAVYGLLGALLAVMPALGPVLGALLDAWLGWRSLFLALAAAMALMLAIALRLWRETHVPDEVHASSLRMLQPLRNCRFWWYVIGYGTGMGAFFVCFSTSPWLLMQRMGHSQMAFSALFASVAGTMVLGSRLVGRLAPRWGLRRSLQRGMACLLVAGALAAFGQWWVPDATWSALLPMWVAGFGIAFAHGVAPDAALRDFSHVAGSTTAWFFCLGGGLAALTGTLASAALPIDTRWPLALYCGLMPTLVLISGAIRLRDRATGPQ